MLPIPTPDLPPEAHVKRFSLLFIVLLALLVAACSSETSSSAEESQATATEQPTPEPTQSEVASTDGALPSLQPGAGDLADILPTEVGGVAITYQSASGGEVLGSGDMPPETRAFFDSIGAEPSDLSSAFGSGFDTEAGQFITLLAFRVAGADEGSLRDQFLATMEAQGDLVGEETTIGGKTVHSFGEDAGGTGVLYVKDDVVYVVTATPADLVEEALAALP